MACKYPPIVSSRADRRYPLSPEVGVPVSNVISVPGASPRPRLCAVFVEFAQHFHCILVTACGKASQLVAIFSLASQLHQHVSCIAASAICQRSQLIEIASLASQLDELVNCDLVTSLRPLPQLHQIGIKHVGGPPVRQSFNRTIPLSTPDQRR